jgi:DNA-directed RNA polymerase specialized sigma24 family protein
MRYFLDMNEREIAAALGCSTGSVKQHASRGLAALRRELKDEDLEEIADA